MSGPLVPINCDKVVDAARRLLLKDPAKWREVLERLVKAERELQKTGRSSLGWQWFEVQLSPQTINKLVREGIVTITFKSRKFTYYRLNCVDEIEQLLKTGPRVLGPVKVGAGELEKKLDDLFSLIVGHDDVKQVLKLVVLSEEPAHALLIGPPATAKTLFLQLLSQLPGAVFVVGYRTTKAGLAEFLIETRPRLLLVDEIDKMETKDINILINLMEEGKVIAHLKGYHVEEQLNTRVIATANTPNIPEYIKSRFEPNILEFKRYTRKDFLDIAPKVLMRLEGIPEWAAYRIAEEVSKFTLDIRAARNLARMLKRFIPLGQEKFEAILETTLSNIRKRRNIINYRRL